MTTYTLWLTKGCHIVTEADARKALDAVHADAKTVELELDFGFTLDSDWKRISTVVVAHIVTVSENKPQTTDEWLNDLDAISGQAYGKKVSRIGRRAWITALGEVL